MRVRAAAMGAIGLFGGTIRDLAPIVLIIAFFQLAILGQPVGNLAEIAVGLLAVMTGLAIFIRGLEMALFPLGEALAHAFARRGSLVWLVLFAFGLGFRTTVAEPALIAVSAAAAAIMAAGGAIRPGEASEADYATALRCTVAISVGSSLVVGVIRILKGWPIHWLIITGYLVVVALTALAPESIVGIAYDSGGVTTSTITVPLVTAPGVGLASVIKGRNPMVDGFGLIALASLFPMITVMGYAQISEWRVRRRTPAPPRQSFVQGSHR